LSLDTVTLYIGYDESESLAYSVYSYSVITRASVPVSIFPIRLGGLKGFYNRPKGIKDSTEFSVSRFLVPYLNKYRGWAIFSDCDMLMQQDIKQLWDLRDASKAIQCVKHNHVPRETSKMMGSPQLSYSMKNWTSLMLMNCEKLKTLTPDYVSAISGLALHQFCFLESLDLVGDLPKGWNYLVGYDSDSPSYDIYNAHFTLGTPMWENCRQISQRWTEKWDKELENLNKSYLHG